MSDNNTHDHDIGIGTLNQQAKETQRGIQRIIAIWRDFALDPDPSIRVLTLMATVIGFVALILFPLLVSSISKDSDSSVDQIIVVGFFCLVFFFLVIGSRLALRLSKRATTKMLETGFEKIYEQKYGAIIGD